MNFFNKHFLITSSALLCSVAFLMPSWLGWLVFIWPAPLFFPRIVTAYSFKEGLCWGFIFFSLYLHGLAFVFIDYIGMWYGLLCYSMLVLYGAVSIGLLYAAARCLGNHWLVRLLALNSIWLFIEHAYFIPFGSVQGLSLASLLIPLTSYPALVYCAAWLPLWLLTILSITIGAMLGLAVQKPRMALIGFIACVPFLIGWYQYAAYPVPSWASSLGICRPQQHASIWDQAYAIDAAIKDIYKKHPSITCIILPESAFGDCLERYHEFLTVWYDGAMPDTMKLIMGAQRAHNQQLFNTLFMMQQCRITHYYDKSHLIWFFEYLPPFWKSCTNIRNLFLKNKEFSGPPRDQSLVLLQLSADCTVTPALCSDLFFNYIPATSRGDAILCLVNDRWFAKCPYIARLMILYARLYAIAHHQPIIYVGYQYGGLLMPDGIIHNLAANV